MNQIPNQQPIQESAPAQPFAAIGFQNQLTRDGSPTLVLPNAESMHHSGGAAFETWYIYGSVIEAVFKVANENAWPELNICSVGLGLGYVEMTCALIYLSHPRRSMKIQMDSFEIVPQLISEFKAWTQNQRHPTESIYDLALKKLVVHKNLPSLLINDVQNKLAEFGKKDHFFHGDILKHQGKEKFQIVCFDAFSKKSTAGIWTAEFLNQFIQQHCAEDCAFTTYACTTELKQALVDHHFILLDRPGFSGKRASTLAVRGEISAINFFQTS